MNNELMFSSKTDMWETPQELYDKLDAVFNFDLDVCACAENAKHPNFFDKQRNGLLQVWRGTCWMNPPYGREISEWVKKAHETKLNGYTVVALLPARTDTSWWHNYCQDAEITFLRGRLKFGGHTNSAPFPSAIVVFRPSVAMALVG